MNNGNLKKANGLQTSALFAETGKSAFNLVQGAIIKHLLAFQTSKSWINKQKLGLFQAF